MFEHNVEELVEFVRKASRQYKEAMDLREKLLNHVNSQVGKAIEESGLPYKFRVYMVSGPGEWTPEAHINPDPWWINLFPDPESHEKAHFHYVGDGKFMWSKHDHKVYPDSKLNNLPAPYDTAKLLEICQAQSESLGVDVTILVSPVVTEIKGSPQSSMDLLVLHPKGKIEHEGEISYHGWDCTDNWAIVSDPETGNHLYFGSTAHGGGMNNHISPGGSFDSFLNFSEGSGTYVEGLSDIKTFFSLNQE